MTPQTAEFTRIEPAVALPAPSADDVRPATAEVLGVPLALTDYERTMDWMDAVVADREPAYLSAAAVHLVMVAQEDEDTRAAVDEATLVVPDGQPLVWALRSLGHEASRVYGPDLMAKYCERSAQTGVRMYLYGGRNQGALVELALRLRRRYPGLQIVGGYSPPFRPLDDDEQQWVIDDINRSKADVVWVGIGQPKQEIWMREFRDRLDAPMLVGVGAAFDFHAGLVPQAPSWMQDVGLEWVYRLSKEPRRLWRRYARYNPRFVAGFARQKARGARHAAR
ncbi:MAG: N-acetylmannosaminyltransferase [uncultured Solirubrobacteraceae bacterium]|uniref:N-acetylmannosaminyltransferase n=1 Tax=uncultured Solirubrobacteraceae bacterium TaxID=1162706 RepID=A0A6J4SN22_9ACTN|nr:MAG: N-acetylmannosaminyltransferase [uncultured Solirubrobacteraceae bacterium]